MQMAIDFTERAARKEGMKAALEHADKVFDAWSDLAFQFLCNYARANATVFAEDVTTASETWNLPQPPTTRAWGGLYTRAQKAKIIEATENTRKRKNGSLAVVYRSLLFKAAA